MKRLLEDPFYKWEVSKKEAIKQTTKNVVILDELIQRLHPCSTRLQRYNYDFFKV